MNATRLIIFCIVALPALVAAADAGLDPHIRAVLTRFLKFGAVELADMERGKAVKHTIATSTPGEIAVAGAVRVNVPKATLLERVRDIVHFKQGPEILQIGRFSNPPAIDDLAALTVEPGDFDAQSCRVADCDTRLPADVIRRAEREVDGTAPDARARSSNLFKQILLDHVKAYVSGSPGRFEQYDDGAKPIRPMDEFAGVVKNTPSLEALVPGLPGHLLDFPAHRVAGADDFLYWSKEKFGVAPFISVTQVTIVCPAPPTCVVATKDVYSSRYVDASLSLTIASDVAGSPTAFYLVYANRSRATALKGRFSALRRSIAERRTRGGVEDTLKTLKIRLETGR